MQRYFLEKLDYLITGNDFHHIKNVMRMKSGDFIIICVHNKAYKAQITVLSDVVKYEVTEELETPKTANITLIQGLVKRFKLEFITKYATMFGISKIIFLPMIRSNIILKNDCFKLNRLKAIAKESSELAHLNRIPLIEFKESFQEIDFNFFDVVLLIDEEEKVQKIASMTLNKQNIAIIIGPEGGIDDKERLFLKEKAVSVTLGKNIISTEAASLYTIAVIKTSLDKSNCLKK